MEENVFIKDPNEVLDYTIDYTAYLSAMSDTISTSVWAFDTNASGMTIESSTNTSSTATVWLSGGSDNGKRYRVRNRIVTAGGRTVDRTILIQTQSK
jgi:hypothetical protein